MMIFYCRSTERHRHGTVKKSTNGKTYLKNLKSKKYNLFCLSLADIFPMGTGCTLLVPKPGQKILQGTVDMMMDLLGLNLADTFQRHTLSSSLLEFLKRRCLCQG
jgi:hypothetical protein